MSVEMTYLNVDVMMLYPLRRLRKLVMHAW